MKSVVDIHAPLRNTLKERFTCPIILCSSNVPLHGGTSAWRSHLDNRPLLTSDGSNMPLHYGSNERWNKSVIRINSRQNPTSYDKTTSSNLKARWLLSHGMKRVTRTRKPYFEDYAGIMLNSTKRVCRQEPQKYSWVLTQTTANKCFLFTFWHFIHQKFYIQNFPKTSK